jgi:hypothetical protein
MLIRLLGLDEPRRPFAQHLGVAAFSDGKPDAALDRVRAGLFLEMLCRRPWQRIINKELG